MQRKLVIVAGLVLVFGVAYAGDYHIGASLICSDCHTMHASLSHTYGGTALTPPVTYTPSKYLLKGGVNQTCLSCHNDDAIAPDVYGLDSGKFMGINRSAGALNDSGGLVDTYSHYMGHSLGSTDTAPGDTGSFVPDSTDGLLCTDCHQQHGYHNGAFDVFGSSLDPDDLLNPNGAYRNLVSRNFGGTSISYAITTNDSTKDVYELFAKAYDQDANFLNEPVPTDSGFGTWCSDCHVNFHGDVGDPNSIGGTVTAPLEKFLRHPNATVNIGDIGGGHSSLGVYQNTLYRVRVMTTTGDWGTQGQAWTTAPANDLTPTCLSCHKAHGSSRAFGLIYAKGDLPLGENGDGNASQQLCQQCHVQGG